jgi:DHA2 family multidrug resistance protein-like MFS transporter
LDLFTNRIFSVTILGMLLTAVIMGGTALFIAEYLQMVMGLSPLYAGIWMIPQAVAMIAGSMLAPMIAKRVRPGIVIATGLFITSIGMLLVAYVPSVDGVYLLETGFVMAVIGVSPILVLGTGIVIGSAPPEKAGAAASVSETSNQLGIALGVAFLGSIGTFIYHKTMVRNMPAGLPAGVYKAARESLAGAISVAPGMDGRHSQALLISAREAFVSGLHVVALVGAACAVLLAGMTYVGLRHAGDDLSQKKV